MVKRISVNGEYTEEIPDYFYYNLTKHGTIENSIRNLYLAVGELIEILHERGDLNSDHVRSLLNISPFSNITVVDIELDPGM